MSQTASTRAEVVKRFCSNDELRNFLERPVAFDLMIYFQCFVRKIRAIVSDMSRTTNEM